jgi:hypothetical protein
MDCPETTFGAQESVRTIDPRRPSSASRSGATDDIDEVARAGSMR